MKHVLKKALTFLAATIITIGLFASMAHANSAWEFGEWTSPTNQFFSVGRSGEEFAVVGAQTATMPEENSAFVENPYGQDSDGNYIYPYFKYIGVFQGYAQSTSGPAADVVKAKGKVKLLYFPENPYDSIGDNRVKAYFSKMFRRLPNGNKTGLPNMNFGRSDITVDGSTFSGAKNGKAVVSGAFYGQNAQGVAGMMSYTKRNYNVWGAFGGKR